MAYSDPLSWKIGDPFNINDVTPSAGLVIQPAGDPFAYVYLRDDTMLVVDKDGRIVTIG